MVVACSDTERRETSGVLSGFWLDSFSLSLYHPHHRNPKSYIAASDNWSFPKQTSVLMVNWGKLLFSHVMHTDDIVRMGGAGGGSGGRILPISVPFYWRTGRVPSEDAQRYFPGFFFFFFYPIRLEGTKHWTVKIRHLNSVDPHFKAFVCI